MPQLNSPLAGLERKRYMNRVARAARITYASRWIVAGFPFFLVLPCLCSFPGWIILALTFPFSIALSRAMSERFEAASELIRVRSEATIVKCITIFSILIGLNCLAQVGLIYWGFQIADPTGPFGFAAIFLFPLLGLLWILLCMINGLRAAKILNNENKALGFQVTQTAESAETQSSTPVLPPRPNRSSK